MPTCPACNNYFSGRAKIDGVDVSLSNRKYCLQCSPYKSGNRKVLAVGGMGKELLKVPQPLAPSRLFAYFIGVFAGDGSLMKTPKTYRLQIACDDRHPYLIEQFNQLVKELLGLTFNTRREKDHSLKLHVCSIDLPVRLQLPTGKKSLNGFRVPDWIFTQIDYCQAFVKGLIETDGGVYKVFHNGGWSWRCQFTNTNAHIMDSFLKASALSGYKFTFLNGKTRSNKQTVVLNGAVQVQFIVDELDLSQKILIYKYGEPKPPRVKKVKPVKPPRVRPSKKPPKEVLEALVWEMPTTKIAERYGVSDKAVEKWCKTYGIAKPSRGYWTKVAGV